MEGGGGGAKYVRRVDRGGGGSKTYAQATLFNVKPRRAQAVAAIRPPPYDTLYVASPHARHGRTTRNERGSRRRYILHSSNTQ